MKVVFLDFDGTLNGLETWEPPSPVHAELRLNPVLVERVNRICERAAAVVVVSSSWRTRKHTVGASDAHLSLEQLRQALQLAGLRAEVVGVTPDLAREDRIGREALTLWRCPPRHKEIRAWVEQHKPEAFAILDDDESAGIQGHFVHCNRRTGLSWADVERAVVLLGVPPGAGA